MSRSSKKPSLAEQIALLSTPKPAAFHPDEDELESETAAKVSDFDYDERQEVPVARSNLRRILDDDPRYAGKTVSRRELEEWSSGGEDGLDTESETESDINIEQLIEDAESDSESEDVASDYDRSESSLDDIAEADQSHSTVVSQEEGDEVATGFSTISLASLQEDIEKGKAAKQQIGMWDGLLEGRIRLQKALALCNQLPQPSSLPAFRRAGSQQLEEALRENQSMLQKLLDSLLELQKILLHKNKETTANLSDKVDLGTEADVSSDEDIPSDFEDDEAKDVKGHSTDEDDVQLGDESGKVGVAIGTRLKRKRKRHEWVSSSGQRDYEGYIARRHLSLRPYQDATISKWNSRTRLASGKLTSKAFVQVDHSVLAQIQHVLNDKQRLIKRTQLKRSVYHVLGEEVGVSEDKQEEQGGAEGEDIDPPSRDSHLKDYDEEIFDDDDFYHQLLRELIERKMNFTETTDPIAMGRQWLELQKLRTKVKKKVDTKASKGRKIRYNVHPKLASFMAPIQRGTMSDVSRNDLFSSLFGGQYKCISE